MGVGLSKRVGNVRAKTNRDAVLRFWFGEKVSPSTADEWLNSHEYLQSKVGMWFGQDDAVDKEAFKRFNQLIHDAGNKRLTASPWLTDAGIVARILLCDQLPRNAFRGSATAFAYDGVAIELSEHAIDTATDQRVPGAFRMFIIQPLMHSEDISLHEKALTSAQQLNATFPDVPEFHETERQVKEHKSVIERFGRYPHRNKVLNRSNTAEEDAWLNSPDRPPWAKSQ